MLDSVYSFEIPNYVDFFNNGLALVESNIGTDTADWFASHIREEHATLDWIMQGMTERAGFRIEKRLQFWHDRNLSVHQDRMNHFMFYETETSRTKKAGIGNRRSWSQCRKEPVSTIE